MKKLLTFICSILMWFTVEAQVLGMGWQHSLVVCEDGTAQAFGSNSSGILGDGTNQGSFLPVDVSGISDVTFIAAGFSHSIALTSAGTVWTWGNNSYGQLGNGNNSMSNVPVQVLNLTNVISIEAGFNHNLAVTAEGEIWTWGLNTSGQLGNGGGANSNIPVLIEGLEGGIAVGGGSTHSVALLDDGSVWTWGANGVGQLGTGDNTLSNIPVQALTPEGIEKIAAGQHHCVALKDDGTVWTWGQGNWGQLGHGDFSSNNTPMQVAGLTDVVEIAHGGTSLHTLVIKADGTPWIWGGNDYGQIGDGTDVDTNVPGQIEGLTGAVHVGVGNVHTMIALNDGTVWSWGWNSAGQLGNGDDTDTDTPGLVIGLCEVPVNCSVTGTDYVITCDNYIWIDGNTYTESNNTAMYTFEDGSENGCDSIVTLDLTIANITGVDVQTACDSITWIDGNTYTADNDEAVYIFDNPAGCDSVVVLDLTMGYSSSSTFVHSACDSYEWYGVTYTEDNNTATQTFANAEGCDSVITLNLTIVSLDNSLINDGMTLTANESGANYQWIDCGDNFVWIDGAVEQDYTPENTGNYAVIIAGEGCSVTSDCEEIIVTGIPESNWASDLNIFPNPTSNWISVQTNLPIHSIELIDVSGRVVLISGQKQMSLESLSGGLYLLRINGHQLSNIKVVKI